MKVSWGRVVEASNSELGNGDWILQATEALTALAAFGNRVVGRDAEGIRISCHESDLYVPGAVPRR